MDLLSWTGGAGWFCELDYRAELTEGHGLKTNLQTEYVFKHSCQDRMISDMYLMTSHMVYKKSHMVYKKFCIVGRIVSVYKSYDT